MTDVFSKKKRSEIMSRIRSKNTQAEKIVFSFLRQGGIKFKKHYKELPGCPDVALPEKKKAVFIDGDFWHGRDFERVKKGRKDSDYWVVKIKSNIRRDRRQRAALKKSGWAVLRIWGSEIKRKRTRQKQFKKIEIFLSK